MGIKDELYMKIIIDNKIPYIKEAVQRIADEVVYAPGKDFTPELVRDADALIVRTRTHCNRDLLEGSRVKFIATATIGFDHIDTENGRMHRDVIRLLSPNIYSHRFLYGSPSGIKD